MNCPENIRLPSYFSELTFYLGVEFKNQSNAKTPVNLQANASQYDMRAPMTSVTHTHVGHGSCECVHEARREFRESEDTVVFYSSLLL